MGDSKEGYIPRNKEVAEMDVRLDVHQQAFVQRPSVGQLRKVPEVEAEAKEVERQEDERVESTRQAKQTPPKVISREELQQFLLLIGTTRGSEELLSSMVHDAARMRSMLLGGKA